MHAWVYVCWQVSCSFVSRCACTSIRSMPKKVQVWHPVSTFMELYLMYLGESLADPGTHRFSSSGCLVCPGTPCLHKYAEELWEDCLPFPALSGFWKSGFYPLMFVWQLLCPLGHLPSTWWYPDSSSTATLVLLPRNPFLPHIRAFASVWSELPHPCSMFFFPKFLLWL